MKRNISLFLWLALMLSLPVSALALLDQFEGDSAIYSGSTQYLRPNVLFIIDNSAGMIQAGSREAYDPAIDYTYTGAPYSRYQVLERKAATGGTINYGGYIDDLDLGVTCGTAKTALGDNGFYAGKLKRDGTCTAAQSGNFFLGNMLNYINAPSTTPVWQTSTLYAAGDKVRPTTPVLDVNGVSLEFEILVAGISGATEPVWPTTVGTTVVDNAATWGISGSIIDMVKTTLKQVIAGARESVNFGVMTFGDNNSGGKILKPVLKMASTDTGGDTNYANAAAAITGITLLNANAQAVNETSWDAGLYYKGLYSSASRISSGSPPAYPSPVEYTCQKNFIIVLTTGSTDSDVQTKAKIGDKNGDGNFGYIDDGAKYLYENLGTLRVQTHVVQLLTPEVARLKTATNAAHGRGSYFRINNANELTQALLDAMANIVNESDTSFVAPVVPTSPENRTYSGERVYLGFFKPITQRPWHGNLKKYGIDSYSRITDKNGDLATNSDGSFSAAAVSFWSTWNDAGKVEEGGVGGVLLARNFATNPRKLYTYDTDLGNDDLTDSANTFNATNITAADLGVVDDAAKASLINYMYGYDAYDDNGNGVTAEKRDWILGDILHSKPLIVNYNSFAFSTTSEADCSINKAMVYVGTNDGMLHAFRDCDGGEEWAFIPPNLFPNLKELAARPAKHTYFNDSSPIPYIYDANHDGIIDPDDDTVLLIFGQRRGGDAYYALDVTTPASPLFKWKIDPSSTGFSNLGETWSEPQIARIKDVADIKEVLIFGAGYDQFEDARYGTAYGVPLVPTSQKGEGNVSSLSSQWIDLIPEASGGWKGKGIYMVELANLSGGSPDFTSSGTLLWSSIRNNTFTALNSYYLWYSMPSEVTVLDTDYNGLADRLYVGDTGGRMWRFDIGNTVKSAWTGKIIFNDPTYSQKLFFRPSVTLQSDYTALFIGSGDREHPLNTNVVNRYLMLKDKNQDHGTIGIANLKDVTTNALQISTTPAATITAILNELNSSTNYGWYVNLNERAGEKVLAPPLAFNKVAYFTTYTPNTVVSTDPCAPGNLGISRLYAVNYMTGEAVLNFTGTNDGESTADNKRALSKDGKVLRRSDRSVTLGVGIPSGIVVIMPPSGDAQLLIGSGGGLAREDPVSGGTIIPIYWMKW